MDNIVNEKKWKVSLYLCLYLQSGNENPLENPAVNIKGDKIKNFTIVKCSQPLLPCPLFELKE